MHEKQVIMDKNVIHTLLISSLSLGVYVVLICHDLKLQSVTFFG